MISSRDINYQWHQRYSSAAHSRIVLTVAKCSFIRVFKMTSFSLSGRAQEALERLKILFFNYNTSVHDWTALRGLYVSFQWGRNR